MPCDPDRQWVEEKLRDEARLASFTAVVAIQ